MILRVATRRVVDIILSRFGFRLIRKSVLIDWQKRWWGHKVELPKGAEEYLTQDNDRLVELTGLYASMDTSVTTPSVWTSEHLGPSDLKYFRSDNPYVWQFQDHNFEPAYVLTTYYVKTIDTLGLLEKLKEDDEFGIYTFRADGRVVSRDFLDSIVEIYFLEKHLGISRLPQISLLDIGAGYGRLAHRIVEALPNIDYCFCTDAIPASTFICEYYLRFRNVCGKARVVPLNQVEDLLANHAIDIAVNVNSFSECTLATIDWWLSRLAKHKVQYLMIVPNFIDPDGRLLLVRHPHEDFLPLVEEKGYRLLAKEPKYRDPVVQQYGVSPTCHYLFGLS
ncbi:putative sugar O-methyltransferase [Chloroflexota bacterium]